MVGRTNKSGVQGTPGMVTRPFTGEELTVYIAGKINGDPEYMNKFSIAEHHLRGLGYVILNPAALPEGMGYEAYMRIGFAMIDEAHAIFMLPDYRDSPGAMRELERGKKRGILIFGSTYREKKGADTNGREEKED